MMNNSSEEMRRNVVVSNLRNAVISPLPVLKLPSSPRSLRSDLNEILDIIDKKSCGEQDPTMPLTSRVSSNPIFTGSPPDRVSNPFFTGSPPSRVSNPMTKDPIFLRMATPSTPLSPRATPSSPRNGGGCVRAVNNPAVRVVGFDCDRRRNNRSISTLA